MRYKIKPTKKQLKIMKKYWAEFYEILSNCVDEITELEDKMSKECKIKDMIFFFPDGIECAGIGTFDRKMRLLHEKDLE